MSSFTTLGVPARLDRVLSDRGIQTPTPIQARTLPDSLAGRDVLGRGRTGSGKTLAFLLPVVARLSGGGAVRPGAPRALILAPTRELAGQIEAALQPLAGAAGFTSCTVFGGVGQTPQVSALRRGVDIVVACPGRLEDLISQRHCSLGRVEITVLDEADHMADVGFLPAVRRLLAATPRGGQRMLFSATLDRAVDALVRQFLTDPAVHQADSAQSPIADMAHHVLHVERDLRLSVLVDLASAPGRTIVFTRTKRGARTLARQLTQNGVPAVELHGNLRQNARTRNLDNFHAGRTRTLVATDIAARGIHVDDVTLVVHADPPADHKAYLHRSGRTARAGNAGSVVTLMTSEQRREVHDLSRAARVNPVVTRVSSTSDPVLAAIAPGARTLVAASAPAERPSMPDGRARGPRRAPAEAAAAGQHRRRRSARRETTTGRDRGDASARPALGRSIRRKHGTASTAHGHGTGSAGRTRVAGASGHSAASSSSGRR